MADQAELGLAEIETACTSSSTCSTTSTSSPTRPTSPKRSPPLPSLIEWAMARWASVLVDRRDFVLLLTTLFWAALTVGWYRFSADNDMYNAFSPEDTQLSNDRKAFEQFFGLDKMVVMYQTTFSQVPDQPNLLSDELRPLVVDALRELQHDVTYEGHNYADFYSVGARSPYDRPNRLAMAIFADDQARSKIRYPMTRIAGEAFFTPLVLGGITTDARGSHVQSARSVLMRYVIKADTRAAADDAWQFMLRIRQRCAQISDAPGSKIKVLAESYSTLTLEGRKNTWFDHFTTLIVYTLPYVPLSAVLMVVIMMITHFHSTPAKFHCAHAMAGLISVAMAYTASMGACFWAGLKYNDLVSVVAFLSMAIGVDDTFVLLSAWRAHPSHSDSTGRAQLLDRTRAMLVDAGTSITFTSLTDVVAFGIGATVRMPALRHFCIFMAAALSMDFLLQITFFPAAMLLCEQLRPKCDPLLVKFVNYVNGCIAKVLPTKVPDAAKNLGNKTQSSALLSLNVAKISRDNATQIDNEHNGPTAAGSAATANETTMLEAMTCSDERPYCEKPRRETEPPSDDCVADSIGDL